MYKYTLYTNSWLSKQTEMAFSRWLKFRGHYPPPTHTKSNNTVCVLIPFTLNSDGLLLLLALSSCFVSVIFSLKRVSVYKLLSSNLLWSKSGGGGRKEREGSQMIKRTNERKKGKAHALIYGIRNCLGHYGNVIQSGNGQCLQSFHVLCICTTE